MTARPIIFSGPMVRAILDGRKTVTRRIARDPAKPYAAEGDLLWIRHAWTPECGEPRWRSPIFMPRSAARLFLLVVSVRAERLQGIDAADIWREGAVERIGPSGSALRSTLDGLAATDSAENLRILWRLGWDRINGKRPGCPWSDNPPVWRVEFEQHTANKGEK